MNLKYKLHTILELDNPFYLLSPLVNGLVIKVAPFHRTLCFVT